jgi:RimJ/RimL family protein N-acetyltransferase
MIPAGIGNTPQSNYAVVRRDWMPAPAIMFTALDPAQDAEALVAFLTANTFPFHVRPRPTEAEAREVVGKGRFWSDDSAGFWIDANRERIGIATLDDLHELARGGNPVFDLRFAEPHRGHRLGAPVLRELTALTFTRFPRIGRFEGHTREDNVPMRRTFLRAGFVKEGHYRDAWPVDGEPPKACVIYAILRRDWEAGATTLVPWDDLPA